MPKKRLKRLIRKKEYNSMDWFNNFIHRKLSRRRMEKNYAGTPQQHLPWWEALNEQINRSKLIGIIILLILWTFCSTVMILPKLRPQSHSLQLNQKAVKTIYAKLDFDYNDHDKTNQLKREVSERIPEYFKISTSRNNQIRDDLNRILLLATTRTVSSPPPDAKASESSGDHFIAGIPESARHDFRRHLLNEKWRKDLSNAFTAVLAKGVRAAARDEADTTTKIRFIDDHGRESLARGREDIPTAQEAAAQIAANMLKSEPEDSAKEMLSRILQGVFKIAIGPEGNLLPQPEHRAAMQKDATARIKPITVEIEKNYPIILRGDSVQPRHIDILDAHDSAYNLQVRESSSFRQIFYSVFRCFLLILLMGMYLYYIHPEVVKNNRKVMICTIVAVAGVTVNYGALLLFQATSEVWAVSPLLINEALPLAMCSILLTVMVGLRVALYFGFFVSSMATMMVANSFDLALSGMIICCIASMAVRNSNNYRAFFVRSLFSVGISVIIIGFCMDFIANELPLTAVTAMGITAFFNGLLTALTALLLLFTLEMVFNVNTNMSLLMCDYNHPLLVELRKKAPGTFHHSLTVSTMVEAAAKAIKFNPIPGRVAALFHDIGKISKPEYFAENIPAANKHDVLRPHMSTMVIMNHVKAGMMLAAKYKLPDIVRKVIEQHHGTDMVYYFYRKAVVDGNKERDTVEEQEFRYPGPLPSDKSVVLVSLADACEASCRSIQKPTSAKIEQMVSDIFEKRIRDGQLDKAEITVGELSMVRDSFIRELISIHHARMAYPKEEERREDKSFVETKKNPTTRFDTTAKDDQPSS